MIIFNLIIIYGVRIGKKCFKKNNKANDDLEFIMEGHTDPKYAEVEEIFRTYFRKKWDNNSQLCVWVGQKCVIDLFGARVE